MDEIFQLLDYLGIQSQSTIQTYARLAQRRHLKKGECLYYGGEDSTNLYFLISGILRGFTVSSERKGIYRVYSAQIRPCAHRHDRHG